MPVTKEYAALLVLLHELKEYVIPYEYVKEEDGVYSCWTADIPGVIQTHGVGATLEECVKDYAQGLREIAESMMEEGIKSDGVSDLCVLKVLSSSEGELLSCLHGRKCEDI